MNATTLSASNITHSSNQTSTSTDYAIFQVGSTINKFGPPVIVAVGTIGNVLSLLVMLKDRGRIGSGGVYVITLAILDTILLWLGLLQYWFLFSFTPWLISETHCHGMFFLVNFFSNYAVWVIVAMTIERCMAVTYPLKFSRYVSMKKTIVVIGCLGLASALKNFHYIWTSDFAYNSETEAAMCAFGLVRKEDWVIVWQWIDTCLASILPFIILIVLNSIIVVTLRRMELARKEMVKEDSNKEKSSSDKQLTFMLLTVSITFVVLTAPLFIFRTYFTFVQVDGAWQEAVYYLGHHVCHKLWYCNNAVNFYLYCITGKGFRKNLQHLCGCHKAKMQGSRNDISVSEFTTKSVEIE